MVFRKWAIGILAFKLFLKTELTLWKDFYYD